MAKLPPALPSQAVVQDLTVADLDASSGSSGNANGGSVCNAGGDIINAAGSSTYYFLLICYYVLHLGYETFVDSAGAGGTSFSSDAYGGNASDGD